MEAKFEDLKGKTLKEIRVGDNKDKIFFSTEDNEKYYMYHSQDCCEHVYIEDICGDLNDLIGKPLLLAEEIIHDYNATPTDVNPPEYSDESFAWTFYKLATIDSHVTIRWYGSSNGYYSVQVDFVKIIEQ